MLFKKKIIICENCGTENPEKSKFCGHCGTPLITIQGNACPSCGNPVNVGDKFCGRCGAKISEIASVERTANTSKEFDRNRRWMRKPTDFAQRFEVRDLKGFFSKKVTIEQGTKAIFLQGGAYKGFLDAGVYTLQSFLQSIIGVKLEERATIIIVDAADVPLTFQFPESNENLRAKNGVAISASGLVSVTLSDPIKFLENYLKREEHVSLIDLEKNIHQELLYIVQQVLANYDASELYGNQTLTKELSTTFQNQLNSTLQNKGLQISNLNCIGFDEGAWKEVLAAKESFHIETEKRAAEYERDHIIHKIDTQEALDYLDSTHKIKNVEQDFELGQDAKAKEHQRAQDKLDFQQDLEEISALKDLQAKNRRQKIEDLDSASIETRILMNGGTAEDVRKLEELKRAQSLTPEQILALQATDPKAAAEALAARAKLASVEELAELRIKDQQAFNQMMQTQYRENAEQMKEVLNMALSAMGQTATARATAQNPGATVISGGMGSPVVVNGSVSQATSTCPHCGEDVPDDVLFCPECGKKL